MSDWEEDTNTGINFASKGRGFTRYNNDDFSGDTFSSSIGRGRGSGGFRSQDNEFSSKDTDDGFKPTKSFEDDDFRPTKSYSNGNDDFRPTSSYKNGDDDFRPTASFDDDGGFKPTSMKNQEDDDFKPSYGKYNDDDSGGFKPSFNRGDRGRGGRGDGRGGGRGRGGRGGRDGGFRRDDNSDGGYKSFYRENDRNNEGFGDDNDDDGFKPSFNSDGERGRGRGRGRGGDRGRRGGRGGDRGRRGGDGPFGRDRNENGDDDFGGRREFGDGDNRRGGRRDFGDGENRRGGRRDFGDGENRRGGRRDFGDNDRRGGRREFGDGDDFNFDEEKKEPINKEIYIPPEPEQDEDKLFGSGIVAGSNFSKFDDIKVQVSEGMDTGPIENFEDAGLRPFVLENIKKCHYQKPSPIQKYGLPIIMKGYDVMACAQTGSGKTAAFLIPIINTLLSDPHDLVCDGSHCEPQCLVMAPTRELVIQIGKECRKFSNSSILKIETAYGGTAVHYQKQRLLNGCHIIVGTSGRLNDYVSRGLIQFGSIRFLVLDEADRMLDMGFMKDVETIVDHETMVPKEQRQTLMFSATFPDEIQKLAGRFLKSNYAFITVGIIGSANTDVEQHFYEVSRRQKKPKLLEILEREKENNTLAGTIIFVETKKTADFLAAYLSENNYPTTSIHGDRLQSQREEALRDFRTKKMLLLVATNVAARGLDIEGVSHVIQYDISKEIDMHVHRIGRTGRVGNKGRATTFYDPDSDATLADALVRMLQQAEQSVPDFIQSGGGYGKSSFMPGRSSNFGARDFRESGNETATDFNTVDPGVEPEEEW